MKKLPLLLLAALAFVNANAQKLPNVQQAGLRAPANLKIDGKAQEWGEFKAQNSATDIWYSIANDDKKLYLVVHTAAGTVTTRAVKGGIKLMVQKNNSKKQEGGVAIKFPFFEKGSLVSFPVKKVGEINTPAQGDSIMKVYNQRIASTVKWIYTYGMTGVDSLVSVYNDKGIQAVGLFDQSRGYTCEMAIDLALLGLTADTKQFTYNITINADPNKMSYPSIFGPIIGGTNGDGSKMNEAQIAAANVTFQSRNDIIYATTDFWGEYTLAK